MITLPNNISVTLLDYMIILHDSIMVIYPDDIEIMLPEPHVLIHSH